MTRKPPDESLQRAAAAIQLSIAITETLDPAEIGNDLYVLMCGAWTRSGKSPEWITAAVEAIDDITRITFAKGADQKWVLAVEWSEE